MTSLILLSNSNKCNRQLVENMILQRYLIIGRLVSRFISSIVRWTDAIDFFENPAERMNARVTDFVGNRRERFIGKLNHLARFFNPYQLMILD